jgi:hypothetical protein
MSRLVHISETLPLWMADTIDYGRHIEVDYDHAETKSLNDLEKTLANYSESRRWSLEYRLSNILAEADCRCFLSLAVKRGLRLYAKEKVQFCSNPEKVSMLECALGGRPCAGEGTALTGNRAGRRNEDMVDHLLTMGILPSPEMINRGLTVTTQGGSISTHESTTTSNGNDGIPEVGPRRRKDDRSLWNLVNRIFR